jgi:hypothetical protein
VTAVRAMRAAFALALVPLAVGVLNVTYQDASMTHLPGKSATVEQLRRGEFPYLNPYASFGQPLAGNPNFGTFFPDTLAFLVLPLRAAFGLHFALAAVLAYAGARRWARAEGHGRVAAEAAAVAFTLSGVFVSAWKFYNTGMALAVAPWVLAAAAKAVRHAAGAGGPRLRRAVAELGLWSALEVLAGEPVVALLTFLLVGVLAAARFSRRGLMAVAGGLALGAMLAGPQVLLTAQIYRDSSREEVSFPFVTATGTSVHPVRFVEQVVAFPFGRPDRAGEGGFTGQAFHDNHTPYLWTLHLGLATLALLARHGRPWRGPERVWYATALAAVVLSFGRYLPLAKKLYPVLSLDGRLRFPVKWWYVVALCCVPLVAHAAGRWAAGERANRLSPWWLALLAAAAVLVPLRVSAEAVAFTALILAAAAILFLVGRRRPEAFLPVALAAPLLAASLPLLLAVLDRPLPDPPRVAGRLFERIRVDTHALPGALPPPERTTREVMRRVAPELWAISGALAGVPYAFDRDPDGSYTDPDRVVRKALDDLPWPERVPRLRLSGVAHVVTDETLPPPFRLSRVLGDRHGVRLYALDGAAPSVRFDGGRFLSVRERAAALVAEVDAGTSGLLVWSRSYFGAWRATVDGQPAAVVLADGHVVGVPVPAGSHRVEVSWPRAPLVAGGASFMVGAVAAALLRGRPRPRAGARA